MRVMFFSPTYVQTFFSFNKISAFGRNPEREIERVRESWTVFIIYFNGKIQIIRPAGDGNNK